MVPAGGGVERQCKWSRLVVDHGRASDTGARGAHVFRPQGRAGRLVDCGHVRALARDDEHPFSGRGAGDEQRDTFEIASELGRGVERGIRSELRRAHGGNRQLGLDEMRGALRVFAAREDRLARLRRRQPAARGVHDDRIAAASSDARRATRRVAARADHVSARADHVSARAYRVATRVAGAISAGAGVAGVAAAARIAGGISAAGGGAVGTGGRGFTRAGERENHEAGEDAEFHGRA